MCKFKNDFWFNSDTWVIILIIAAIAVFVLGCAGPSKERLQVLLGECREQNRARVHIIKEYERQSLIHPEQNFGGIEFSEVGY